MKNPLQFTFLIILFIFSYKLASAQIEYDQKPVLLAEAKLDVNHDWNLNIFPNPNKGIFKAKWKHEGQIEKLKLINPLGEEVKVEYVYDKKEHQFDISNQPDGLYFLKVITQNGESLTKIYLHK